MSSLFPELSDEGSGPEQRGPRPVEVPIGKDPAGKKLVCGTRGRATWESLLALPADVSLDGVEVPLETGRIRLSLSGVEAEPVVFEIVPCWPEEGSRRDFYVGLAGKAPEGRTQTLLHSVSERLGSAGYKTLVKACLRDPERSIEKWIPASGGGEDGPEEIDFEQSLVKTWGSSRAWREFYADQEQKRNFHHRLSGDIVMLEHGDLECHYSTQPSDDGTVAFFNYTTVHVSEISELSHSHRSEAPPYLITDVQENDIIMGGIPKFDAALDSIARRDHKPELVIARGTCPTIVVGDDMRGAVKRFEERSGIPTVFLDHLEDGEADPFQSMFESLQEGWGEADPEAAAGRVNLVGFPKQEALADLRRMVRALGLEVNADLIPDVSLAEMRRFSLAECAVFFDSALYKNDYQRLFGSSPVAEIRPPAPFGPTACRTWLETLAKATGREAIVDAVWELHWDVHRAEWESLLGQVDGYRLGFVVDQERLALLRHPERRTGTPVIRVLQEMGFGLDFLCFGTDPEEYRAAVEDLDAGGSVPSTIACFATEEELADALRDARAVAFYSEFFFDNRLTRTGKAQFSVGDFHMGLLGALMTLKKLLRVCRLPFYRAYGRYLGEPFRREEPA